MGSYRSRVIVIAVALALLLLAMAVYTEKAVTEAARQSEIIKQDQRELGQALNALSDSLHQTGIAVYQYSFFADDDQPPGIQHQLQHVQNQVDSLVSLSVVNNLAEVRESIASLQTTILSLNRVLQHLIEVHNDIEQRYPAMPILLRKLQPTNREFMAAVSAAIDEAKNEPGKTQLEVLDTLREIRYFWAQLVSSVRVFVANRLGAFGPPAASMLATASDRKLYSEAVAELLVKLDRFNERNALGLVQADALQRMKDLHRHYEQYFKQAAEIYFSENWRADRSILKDEVQPLLESSLGHIYRIQERVNALSQAGMHKSIAVADTASSFVWIFAGLVFVLVLGSYTAFEFAIRRPILQVAKALEAEGRGESYLPTLRLEMKETSLLVNAFAHMKEQIRSRQSRLQAILDHAGEGIITVDERGIVETFNDAAEKLFRHKATDVVGQHIAVLLPASEVYLAKELLASVAQQPPGTEREIIGRRSDSSVFHMSIKFGEMYLEGRRLFTALVSDISERRAMVDRLTQLAERDSLTGLYNRHYLMDELQRIIERSSTSIEDTAFLYIDLDNFKFVNDTLGHLSGDRVLTEVSELLQLGARNTDLLARLGGDEFAIILYGVTVEQAKVLAESFRRQLADYIFEDVQKSVDIGCSIGIAMLGCDITSKEALLAKADLACHIAKRSGRNRVHLYEAQDQRSVDTMSADMGWARRIKQCIEYDRFVMALQPLVETSSGKVSSYEILLRMKDENGDIILPSGFLPSADRIGLSVEIDRAVIRNAVKMAAERREQGCSAHYAINLSAKSIGDESILQLITAELDRSGVDPTAIVFEVTETGAIANMTRAAAFLSELRNLGFKTALDDFGVGYSTFSYLKDLPVDYVKIDGSFVHGVAADRVKQAMVKSMVEVAHALGKQTVAEFVEDKATMDFLQTIQVDFCQGFYVGKPKIDDREHGRNVYQFA